MHSWMFLSSYDTFRNKLLNTNLVSLIHLGIKAFEEIGNDIYPPMKRELIKNNIPFERHYATRITKEDYGQADYIFYMDEENHYSLLRMFPHGDKILPIYKYTTGINEIEDPWYTGRFDKVVSQITRCVKDILKNII